jgi:tellurite resistance protein
MTQLLITIVVVFLAAAALLSTGVFGNLKFVRRIRRRLAVRKIASRQGSDADWPQPDLSVLNCWIRPLTQQRNGLSADVLAVEICGSIHTDSDTEQALVHISLTDITDGIESPLPVRSRFKRWHDKDSGCFVFTADLGKIPKQDMVLQNWMTVGSIEPGWLIFARRGTRILRLNVSIVSRQSGQQLSTACCTISYENPSAGYLELPENIERAKTLAVSLAFAVSAADKKLYDCEVQVIKDWARDNIEAADVSDRAKCKLEKALDKTIEFFSQGNQLDTHKVCREIVEIVPVADRYDVLGLCLRVAQANGTASADEVQMITKLAAWLDVDMDKFRAMMEKTLPVGMHEAEDAQAILGITQDMDQEQRRHHLNAEYRKWNARVTSSDAEICSQADQMLKLIAEARKQNVAQEA